MFSAWGKVWLGCAALLTATFFASLGAAARPASPPSESVNASVGDAGYEHVHGRAPDDSVPDSERIRSHLEYAEHVLRQADISQHSPEQRAARERVLGHLNDYWRAGRFPLNTYTTHRAPVFIDAQGTLCAVGHLVAKTAGLDRARAINAFHQLDHVQDMRVPWLARWASDHGLSVNELSIVQPSYRSRLSPTDRLVRSFVRSLDAGPVPAAVHACLQAEPWWSPHRISFVQMVTRLRYAGRRFDLDVSMLSATHQSGQNVVTTPTDARRLRACLAPVLARQRPPAGLLGVPFYLSSVARNGDVTLHAGRSLPAAKFPLTVEEVRAEFEGPARAQQLAACFAGDRKPGFELSLDVASTGAVERARAWLETALPDSQGCVERVARLIRFRDLGHETQLRLVFDWSKTRVGLVALPRAEHDPFDIPEALEPAHMFRAFRELRAPLGHCLRGQVPGHQSQLQVRVEPLGSISEAYFVPAQAGGQNHPATEACVQSALRRARVGRLSQPASAVLLLELLDDLTLVPIALQPREGMAVARLSVSPTGLRFEQSPGFEFFVNGVSVGLSPTSVALVAGPHSVVARHADQDLTRVVEVHGGRQRRVQVIDGELVVE